MAKRIAFFAESGKSVEACPAGNTYPTGAITISASSKVAGDFVLYEKTDVSDSFHTYGQADIYVDGVFVRTILYDPNAGALGAARVDSAEISSDAITTAKIADGQVTAAKTDFAY